MKFDWRSSETDPAQALARVTGTDTDLDKTPVVMFALANGREIGMSMREIGDLVENHNLLLEATQLPTAERKRIEDERAMAIEGAEALAFKFNELLDDRLRPHKPAREAQPGPAQQEVFAGLMARLKVGNMRHE